MSNVKQGRPTERSLQKSMVALLKKDDPTRMIVKLTMLGKYGMAGLPDLLILEKPKDAWFIEVKIGNNKPTKLQAAMHERLRGLGFDVYVLRTMAGLEKLL